MEKTRLIMNVWREQAQQDGSAFGDDLSLLPAAGACHGYLLAFLAQNNVSGMSA
jgi:hypothetical protein